MLQFWDSLGIPFSLTWQKQQFKMTHLLTSSLCQFTIALRQVPNNLVYHLAFMGQLGVTVISDKSLTSLPETFRVALVNGTV
jgi:hypothetical protein